MTDEKLLMAEAATLYYEQNLTQQQIAQKLQLTRQTVSRLLTDAVKEKIVQITIRDPQKDRAALEAQLCREFGLDKCIVCGVSSQDPSLQQLMTVKAAATYLLPILQQGGKKIALSWGRTVQALIAALPHTVTQGNTVFPLFGATDSEHAYFSSNELARSLADRLGAQVKCAWFPYMAEDDREWALLQQLSYYKKMQALWDSADLAILGIGNTQVLDIFGRTFGYSPRHACAIGDVATHFFDENGEFVPLYPNTLCAGAENLRHIGNTVAIACGTEKAQAILGALRTGLLRTLITDEHTAQKVLQLLGAARS